MASNMSMNLTLYMPYKAFICIILFGLLELFKIILFKDLVGKKIEAKVAGKCFFLTLFCDFELNYLMDKIFRYGYIR